MVMKTKEYNKKGLECLLAWKEYYKIYNKFNDFNKIIKEIEDYKSKLYDTNRPIVPIKRK